MYEAPGGVACKMSATYRLVVVRVDRNFSRLAVIDETLDARTDGTRRPQGLSEAERNFAVSLLHPPCAALHHLVVPYQASAYLALVYQFVAHLYLVAA